MSSHRLFGRETLWLGFWLLAGAVSVVAYNTWLVCCGACSFENLLSLGWPGWLLLVANLVAVDVYAILRKRNYLKLQTSKCSCRLEIQSAWRYCPRCGKDMR